MSRLHLTGEYRFDPASGTIPGPSNGQRRSVPDFERSRVGSYLLCAPNGDSGYLDPCRWGTPSYVSLDKDVLLSAILLKEGHQWKIHLLDPLALVVRTDQAEGLGFAIGAKTRAGIFFPALATKTKAGFDLHIAVPKDSTVDLWIYSRLLSIVDSQNTAAAPLEGGRYPNLIFAAGALSNVAERAFRIVGRR